MTSYSVATPILRGCLLAPCSDAGPHPPSFIEPMIRSGHSDGKTGPGASFGLGTSADGDDPGQPVRAAVVEPLS
jgi:hypothetical protein